MLHLGQVEGMDILAVFGDLCDGAILKMGNSDFQVLEKFKSSIPVVDAVLLQEKNSSRLIMASKSNSGRLIEYKMGIPIRAISSSSKNGFEGVTGIWSLKTSEKYHSHLVISFVEETRILHVYGMLDLD